MIFYYDKVTYVDGVYKMPIRVFGKNFNLEQHNQGGRVTKESFISTIKKYDKDLIHGYGYLSYVLYKKGK